MRTVQSTSLSPPPVPKYSIDKILKLRKKILNKLGPINDQSFTGSDFYSLVDDIHLCVTGVEINILFKSLQHLAGQVLTYKIMDELAWRIAGNLWRLRQGTVVPPYTSQPIQEWCPMQVLEVSKRKARYKIKGTDKKTIKDVVDCSVQILGGYPAGKVVTKRWLKEYLTHSSTKKEFGYSAYDRSKYNRYATSRKDYLLNDVTELTNNRFFGLIDPVLCDGQPSFKLITSTATLKKWNRELVDKRERTSFVCPMNYDINKRPCFMCEVGYDRCQNGCHPRTYDLGKCLECSSSDVFLDRAISKSTCVDCLPKEVIQ